MIAFMVDNEGFDIKACILFLVYQLAKPTHFIQRLVKLIKHVPIFFLPNYRNIIDTS